MDVFVSEDDVELGKVVKRHKPNPLGEDAHLLPDGSVVLDEAKIIRAQQIFKQNWYNPGGPGARRVLEKYKKNISQV